MLDEIEAKLIKAFLPDKQFVASQISISEKFLFENVGFTKYDHCFHEFDSILEYIPRRSAAWYD